MAALTNTQISVTYVGLLKTTGSTVLSSTAQQITDGSGNNSILYLSTAGVGIGGAAASGKELDVTGNVLVTGDLIVDNIKIDGNTISAESGVVTLSNGAIATTQSQNDNSTKIATTAYVDTAIDGVDTLAEILAIGNTTGATKISVNNTSSGIDFIDDAKARFGTGNDAEIYGSSDHLYIDQNTADKDIILRSDDGSGGITEYYRLDGSSAVNIFSKNILYGRTSTLGSNANKEIQIYDGTSSAINIAGGDYDYSWVAHSGGTFKLLTGSTELLEFGSSIGTSTETSALMISSGNLVSKRTLGSNAFNSTAFVDGSGTANDVVMWSDSNTLTDAPIAISSNDATFAGNVDLKSNAGNATKHLRIWNEGTAANDDAVLSWTAQGSRTYSMGIHRDSGNLVITNADASVASGDIINIDNSQNVGLGTTSPNAKLDILGASSDQLRLRTSESEEYKIGRNSSTGLLEFYGTQSGYTGYVFGGVNGTRLTIDSSGNATFAGKILIGTGATAAASLNAYTQTVSSNLFSALRVIENSGASSYWDIGATGGSSTLLNFYHNGNTTAKISFTHTGGATFAGSVNVGTGLQMYTDGSGNGIIYNLGQDKDLYFVGDDGGTGINALVFDMSEGGNATFAGTIESTGLNTFKNSVAASTDLDSSVLKLQNTSDGGSGIEFINSVAGKSKISFGVESTGAGTDDTFLAFSTSANTTMSEKMRIDSSGNTTFAKQVIIQDNTSQPLSGLFEGTLVVQGSTDEDPIIAVTDVNTASAAAAVFHQSATSPSFPAFVINAASNGNAQPLISARTNVNNTSGLAGTEVFAVDGGGNATFAGNVIIHNSSNAPYIDFVESGATTDSKARITMDQVNTDNASLIFSTEGSGNLSERMRIDPAGVLQIGITASQSQARLNVRENGSAIEFGHTNTSNYFYGTLGSFGSSGVPFISFSCMNEHNANTWTTQGLAGNIINGDTNGNLLFQQVTALNTTGQTPTERMRITSGGGIEMYRAGNTNGGTLLLGAHGSGSNKWSFLAGTHYNQDTGSGNGSGSAGVAIIGCFSDSNENRVHIGGNPFELNAATAIIFNTHTSTTSTNGGTERMRIDSSGGVGIGAGTIPADHRLQIHNPSFTYSRFALTNSATGSASGDGLKFQIENLNAIIKNQENGYLTFGTNGRETDLRIDSSGNVLVGGSGTANVYLGNIITAGSSNRGMRLHTNNADVYFDFQGDSSTTLFFRDYDGSGGTHSRHSFDLQAGGAVFTGSLTQNGSISDKKYKENIKTISNGIDKIQKLNPVEFDWNDKSDAHKIGKKEDAGFIAQEVQKVLPNLVNENVDGDLALNYEGIIPYLVQSIQELKKEIEILKNK